MASKIEMTGRSMQKKGGVGSKDHTSLGRPQFPIPNYKGHDYRFKHLHYNSQCNIVMTLYHIDQLTTK